MKTIKFIANGKDRNFDFKFPFFQKTDVIIEVNSQPAMKYNLICVSSGVNADQKFCGGQVQFFKPPKHGSVITIKRKLPVKRVVDYQPTLPYSPTTHNQDMNYIVEILRDIQDFVDSLIAQPSEAANKEMIDTISRQIEQILLVIDDLRQEIENADDIDLSGIYNSLENLTDSIDLLTTLYNQVKTQIENMDTSALPDDIDYVTDFQNPTAENNYTWYKKYNSGRLEQGGITNAVQIATVTFPIQFASNPHVFVAPIGLIEDRSFFATVRTVSATGCVVATGKWRQDGLIGSDGNHPAKSWLAIGMAVE